MLKLENTILESKRLTYRLLSENDFADLYNILKDPDVTIPAGFMPFMSEEDFRTFFDRITQNNASIAILKHGEIIGYLHVNRWYPDVETYKGFNCAGLGFVIAKEHQNNGYATEMLQTITKYLKNIFDYCFADHFEDNPASKRVIEKSGYSFVEKYTMYFDELDRNITCFSYVF